MGVGGSRRDKRMPGRYAVNPRPQRHPRVEPGRTPGALTREVGVHLAHVQLLGRLTRQLRRMRPQRGATHVTRQQRRIGIEVCEAVDDTPTATRARTASKTAILPTEAARAASATPELPVRHQAPIGDVRTRVGSRANRRGTDDAPSSKRTSSQAPKPHWP